MSPRAVDLPDLSDLERLLPLSLLLTAVHWLLIMLARSAAAGETASSGIALGGGGDKDKDKAGGGGLLHLVGRKRARLLPERPFEKITPEAGEGMESTG